MGRCDQGEQSAEDTILSLLVIVSLLSYLAGAVTIGLIMLVLKRRAVEAATEYFNKLSWIMEHYVEGEDGKFCFPDGDIWDCKPRPRLPDTRPLAVGLGFHKDDLPHG